MSLRTWLTSRRWPGRREAFSLLAALAVWQASSSAHAGGAIGGQVRDQSGLALPGVSVELRADGAAVLASAVTDDRGVYAFDLVPAGAYQLSFKLINFATRTERRVVVAAGARVTVDTVLMLAVSADITVTGRHTFTNLADVENPAENLVGIAFAASQGAVTAAQLETRPFQRAGEVLETVPGVIISQHSGEGKANQYYLRGFNLDHGTDFATTVAGMPVNLPTHAHGHGYTDLNFLIPELVSGVQFSKGPYLAEQGDFSAAGAATINYVNTLARPLVSVSGGEDGWLRALAAASPAIGPGHLLAAIEVNQSDGPWVRPEDYRRVNGLLRFSLGNALNGLSVTALGYRAIWNSTDQVPSRAIASGLIDRFGGIDPTDGGDTSRVAVVFDLQRSGTSAVRRATAYAFRYELDLFSNFTYFLDHPEQGDQFEQVDSRLVVGGRATERRLGAWAGRPVQHTYGIQVRHDDIGDVGLHRTRARQRLATVRADAVAQTSVGAYYQQEFQWSGSVRSQLGLRADVYRFDVESDAAANSGTRTDGIVSPKGGVVFGPWRGTEFYANGGFGFHSNDARGATITVDPTTGESAERVTPLVRATGAEVGLRTVAVRRLQATATLWTLALDSELLFVGDAGTTEASRPSRRTGVEVTAYYSPLPGLTLDADWALSRARFTDADPTGDRIPGAVETVVSGGVAVAGWRRISGSARLRYFGPRPLVEDDSVRSQATSLVNLQAGYALADRARLVLDVFNLFDRRVSDIDYYYASRLPGEPAEGIDDVHSHPALPRTVRVQLQLTF